jgi:hypothetical protein
MSERQCTADVLMIRPANFCANSQTAESNRFQHPSRQSANAQVSALGEFDGLVAALRQAGVRVHVFADRLEPVTPDALFPNNWVSFHSDARVVLYPMLAANRRAERREDILQALAKTPGFHARRIVDLTHGEAHGLFLEGTGSLVLDRVSRVAYACLSPRTHLDLLGEFAQQLDYELVPFEAADKDGTPIYHTNVLLSVGRQFAVVCLDAIRLDQRSGVAERLRTTGHAIVEISQDQMSNFAGNILELSTESGSHIVALSERAKACLTEQQRAQLVSLAGPLVAAPIPTIETLGGGSVRCMLAEIHLPSTERA